MPKDIQKGIKRLSRLPSLVVVDAIGLHRIGGNHDIQAPRLLAGLRHKARKSVDVRIALASLICAARLCAKSSISPLRLLSRSWTQCYGYKLATSSDGSGWLGPGIHSLGQPVFDGSKVVFDTHGSVN